MNGLTDDDYTASRIMLGDPVVASTDNDGGMLTRVTREQLEADEAEAAAVAAEAVAAAAQARARAAQLKRLAYSPETDTSEPICTSDSAATGNAVDHPSQSNTNDPRSPEADPVSAAHERVRSVRGHITGALAVGVTLACFAFSGYSILNHQNLSEEIRRSAEFTNAARDGVVALTSLDFTRAEDDVQRIIENSTGAFREDFEGRAADFTEVIRQSQVATEGTVNGTALESVSDDSAVVIVAASSTVTNSAGAEQEPRAWRLSVTITREDGALKMSKVEFVP